MRPTFFHRRFILLKDQLIRERSEALVEFVEEIGIEFDFAQVIDELQEAEGSLLHLRLHDTLTVG